jgi:hypothetical protein
MDIQSIDISLMVSCASRKLSIGLEDSLFAELHCAFYKASSMAAMMALLEYAWCSSSGEISPDHLTVIRDC